VTLAGHGVVTNSPCNSDNGSTGNPTNCCATLASSGLVNTLLDTTLGTINNPNVGPAIPWTTTSPGNVNSFPGTNSAYNSISNLLVESGVTNDLSARISVNFGGTSTIPMQGFSIGVFSNTTALPAPHATATFTGSNAPLSFYLVVGGTSYKATGACSLTTVVSNTGSPSALIKYLNNPPSQTNFTLQTTAFTGKATWAGGTIYLALNPASNNVGSLTVGQRNGAYTSASELILNVKGSTDNVNFYPGSSPLQLLPGVPAATPLSIYVSRSGGNVVLNWNNSFVLQSTPSPFLPWSNVSAGPISGPYTNPISGAERFFRLAAH
jgi:hypothetical protein